MEKRLDREEIVRNFSNRALEGKGFGPVLEMDRPHANLYRNYATNRLVKNYLNPHKTDVILDFGCGVGRVARYLADFCQRVEAVDASPEMLRVATQNFTNPSNIRYHQLTKAHGSAAVALPFDNASMDKIFTFWVLQHVDDAEIKELMIEFKRVLKPGGRIALFEQTLPVTMVMEGWSVQRNAGEYVALAESVGLKCTLNKPALRNPSRGMSEWVRINKNWKWLMPLLFWLDERTLNRKPEFVYYYTSVVVLEK